MSKFKRLLVCASAAVMLFSAAGFAGCKRDKIAVDPSTINVRVFQGGYGVDWIYDLKNKFETAYADEGYKVNILTPSSDERGDIVYNDLIAGYEEKKIDLVFTTDLYAEKVAGGDEGYLVEDITDTVYNKPAIDFDGEEESVNIVNKMKPGADSSMIALNEQGKERYYGFNWVSSIGGMVVNTKKLSAYGLELPKTTDEMLDAFEAIYLGTNGYGNSTESRTYPITYVQGSNGYALCMLNTHFAQYTGYDDFLTFWSMLDENGQPMTETGKTLYEDQGLFEMLNVAFAVLDPIIAAPGSQTQTVGQAQGKIMADMGKDDAVFMCVGDWMLNEVRYIYSNKLNDIEFINFPVVSALGTELFGPSSGYKLSEAAADELLSYLVGLVDENLDIEDIISRTQTDKGITLNEADAMRVAEARGIYFSRGVEHLAFIPKGSSKKDISELFLRMFASDDFAPIYAQTTNGTSPYTDAVNTNTDYKFVEEASRVAVNQYAKLITSYPRGLRRELGLMTMFISTRHIPMEIASRRISMFNSQGQIDGDKTRAAYAEAANTLWGEEKADINKNWANWIANL